MGAGDLLQLPEQSAVLHAAETVGVAVAKAYLRTENTVGEKRTGHRTLRAEKPLDYLCKNATL